VGNYPLLPMSFHEIDELDIVKEERRLAVDMVTNTKKNQLLLLPKKLNYADLLDSTMRGYNSVIITNLGFFHFLRQNGSKANVRTFSA
jgi:hypothetical protein